jgi:hypothetical protein
MIADPLRRTTELLHCTDALRNGQAMALLMGTLVVATLVMGAGGWLAQVSMVFSLLFALMALAVVLWGAHAVGVMMWDEANGLPARPWVQAIEHAVHHGHRLLGVSLLVAAGYLLMLLVLWLLVLVCKLPFVGPIFYVLVFPLGAMLAGVALVAVPAVVVPLVAPALWSGQRIGAALAAAAALARQRGLHVILWMMALGVLLGLIASLAAAVVLAGLAAMSMISATLLGPAVLGGVAGPWGPTLGPTDWGAARSAAAYVLAAGLGSGILMALAVTAPVLVYLRGACVVYLMARDGLDLPTLQADLQAQARARWQQVHDRFATPSTSATPATANQPEAHGAAPSPGKPDAPPTAAAAADAARTACPQCGAAVQANDVFCAECGFALRPRPHT